MKRLFFLLAPALTALAASAVTLNVTVPAGTQQCYVAGSFNGWSTSATPMTKSGTNLFTIDLPDVTVDKLNEGYKYCSGPDWKYVEKKSDGGELSNRKYVDGNDVVARWAALYELPVNLSTATINVNGYDRKVQILLPDGYETSGRNYPVVYYVGVQQRFDNAGDDSDAGDNFFASNSWGAATLAQSPAFAANPCIMVATYSFVAENIPYATEEFVGSGASDNYLNGFITNVMGYVNSNYRTLAGAENTAIMGADLGGMLAMYATMTHPEIFGRCLAMSPLLWVNHSEMSALASTFISSNPIVVTYGSAEPSVISDNIVSTPSTSVITITNGNHNDESWGSALSSFYTYLTTSSGLPAEVSVAKVARRAPRKAANIAETTYEFWCHNSDANSLGKSGSTTFAYHTDYVTAGGRTINARVAVRVIPASNKSKFYWNVKRAGESDFLLSSAGSVSFSSKKTADSWLRITIDEDEVISNVAVSSKGFTMKNAAGSTTMTSKSDYVLTCNATFDTSDKTFTIHYGSVNSQSDMGAITATQSVSSTCTKATIEYDFERNKVTVTETDWGDVIDTVNISNFSATPSFTFNGDNSHIAISLDEAIPYTATLTASLNYGSGFDVTLTPAGTNSWTADLTNLSQGIYTLTLNLRRGSAAKDGVASICIKVVGPGTNNYSPYLVANAYEGINWATINRYKANFHTHTSQSFDTEYRTDIVVDRYHNAGYKILALTDHDANPYPWDYFDLYNPRAVARSAESLGMLAIPGIELSKDNTNSWHESVATGEFNHHNDFFTGRKGQEFATLRESYAYTNAIGGMQIINHPGQYWSIDKEYSDGEKNSPSWHAKNFTDYPSLIGLEVYNQGNRRPNDRILWDEILTLTMPKRPVWGYSCDDTHTIDQYFRNYEFMLMPELSLDALKQCMRKGALVFSYEYTGSGENLAPIINSISVNEIAHTITIDTDATDVKWIAGTDRNGGVSTRKSTVVGIGKTFDYTGFKGSYVRALITNDKGETCTQPFGFSADKPTDVIAVEDDSAPAIAAGKGEIVVSGADKCSVYTPAGICVYNGQAGHIEVAPGLYIVSADNTAAKVMVK